MSGFGISKEIYHFPGISILVPDQIESDIEIVPINLPIRFPKGFEDLIIRPIANIALFRWDHIEEEYYDEPVQEFNPPIELRVSYNFYDICQVGCNLENLNLYYWDMERKEWVLISDLSHEYQILPPSTAQVAEAKIWSWVGDPTIAWGK